MTANIAPQLVALVKAVDGEPDAPAVAEDASVQTVRMGGTGPEAVNWQAHAWFLERKYPARYGKRDPQRQELADLEKRCKQLEIETAEAKLALLKATGELGQ